MTARRTTHGLTLSQKLARARRMHTAGMTRLLEDLDPLVAHRLQLLALAAYGQTRPDRLDRIVVIENTDTAELTLACRLPIEWRAA